MTKLKDIPRGGKYVSGKEIEGKNIPVTIEKITYDELPGRNDGDPVQHKYVAWFVGKEKGLVLNQTNLQVLENLGLEDTDLIPTNFPTLILHTVTTEMGPGPRLRSAATSSDDVPF